MFVRLKNGELGKLVRAAIQKAGSERKLASATGIPPITLYHYKNEMQNMPQERFAALIAFLGISKKEAEGMQQELLPSNWGRVKGGKSCLEKKKRDGTWDHNFEKMKTGSAKKARAWHRKMKLENPEKYHMLQYERFKKVGGYKVISARGERMRNSLEKEIADLLFGMGVAYEYEPLVKGKKNYYFPDFKIGKMIIECSMWRGEEKAYKLLHKINDLQKEGYGAIVVVPYRLRHFYKVLDRYLITDMEEIRNRLSASVAQSLLEGKAPS